MEGNIPQQNQEKNLALERQEAVKRQNELQKEYDVIPEEDKEYKDRGDADKYGYRFADNFSANLQEGKKVDDKIETIDEYRELATSKENLNLPEINNNFDIERIKIEKEKIDHVIEETKKDIESITNKLNELRSKLGMPPSDDIPSLIDKKENLGNLLVIQKDLENKLSFEKQKDESQKEENFENTKIENKNIAEGIEEMSSSLKKISSLFNERQSLGYNAIFDDEDGFSIIANKLVDGSNGEEIKNNLTKLGNIVEDFADNRGRGIRDDTENLYIMISALKQLSASILDLPRKLQNEEERKKMAQTTVLVSEKVDGAISRIAQKANAIEEFSR